MSHGVWQVGSGKRVALDRARIMAILNVTPDSFHDGGVLADPGAAVAAAERAVESGADILDIGGESTRPGASRVAEDEQIRRVIPAIRAIRRAGGVLQAVPISVDTTRVGVARAALDVGADAVNDVSGATEDAGILSVAAEFRAGIVLMHRLRPPDQDSYSDRYTVEPTYADVVGEVRAFLSARSSSAIAAGIPREGIVLDPGLGFGKTVAQNLELIRRTGEIAALGFPVLSGLSRKSFTAAAVCMHGSTPADRLAPTLALSLEHRAAGASIFRVHDVSEHVRILR
jgi:dihydropteroate synthase